MQISAFNAGLATVHNSQQRVDRAAGEIASASLPRSEAAANAPSEADLAVQLVELQRGKLDAAAGVKLIKTSDEMLGTLIDTRA